MSILGSLACDSSDALLCYHKVSLSDERSLGMKCRRVFGDALAHLLKWRVRRRGVRCVS